MGILNKIGVNRQGFSLLLCARIYATFVRPKFEYGLAISKFTAAQVKEIERLQDRCLRMMVGGHATSSTCAYNSFLPSCPLSSWFLPAVSTIKNIACLSNQGSS
ncbi:hypothetical protein G6F64_014540 [Rhizopus arrhizus]|uniref:Uncharacterized protein n=1 Tax=Rhizopus oryzae TaxID=64495 RepID=A0A9P7BJ89_RHIOR|nr:hypothetical protein G6F64_014540 [Rhizopus arrhizus]